MSVSLPPLGIVVGATVGSFVLVHLLTAGLLWEHLRGTDDDFGVREAYRVTYRETGLGFVAAGMPVVAYAFFILEEMRASVEAEEKERETA